MITEIRRERVAAIALQAAEFKISWLHPSQSWTRERTKLRAKPVPMDGVAMENVKLIHSIVIIWGFGNKFWCQSVAILLQSISFDSDQ